jgi:hypothetical protein
VLIRSRAAAIGFRDQISMVAVTYRSRMAGGARRDRISTPPGDH